MKPQQEQDRSQQGRGTSPSSSSHCRLLGGALLFVARYISDIRSACLQVLPASSALAAFIVAALLDKSALLVRLQLLCDCQEVDAHMRAAGRSPTDQPVQTAVPPRPLCCGPEWRGSGRTCSRQQHTKTQ